MEDINKQINEVIEKNIPTQVGQVLKKRLDRLEKLEADEERIQKLLEQKNDRIQELENELGILSSELDKHDELEAREKAVLKRERRQDVHDANLKAEEAEKRAEQAKELVQLVFKSPVYRTKTTKPVPVQYDQHSSGVEYHEETKEKTEE